MAIYSASVVAVDTEVCLRLPQNTGPFPIRPTHAEMLLRSTRSLAQSASDYVMSFPFGPKQIRNDTVDRR